MKRTMESGRLVQMHAKLEPKGTRLNRIGCTTSLTVQCEDDEASKQRSSFLPRGTAISGTAPGCARPIGAVVDGPSHTHSLWHQGVFPGTSHAVVQLVQQQQWRHEQKRGRSILIRFFKINSTTRACRIERGRWKGKGNVAARSVGLLATRNRRVRNQATARPIHFLLSQNPSNNDDDDDTSY